MPEPCGKGEIRRSSYKKKSYKKKDGTKIKGSKVRSSCIEDKGKIGKGRKLFVIKDGGLLTKEGYSLKKNKNERRVSIRKASREKGMLSVLRHLNAIRTLQKSNPKNFKKLNADVKYIQEEYKNKKNYL
jgi:hypothetical protein